VNRTYHLKWSVLALGVGTFFGLGAAGIGLIAFGFGGARPANGAGRALAVRVALAAVPLFFSTTGCVLVLAWFRHRLTVSDTAVESVGILSTRRVEFGDALEARWRRYGTLGRLRLRTATETLVIAFSEYPCGQGRELVRFFRHRLGRDIQVGWERFWRLYWPRFDEPDPARHEHFARETRLLRRRLIVWLSLGTALCVAVGLAVWRWTGDPQALRGMALFLIFWPCAWLAKADRGKIAERAGMRMSANAAIVIGLVLFGLDWAAWLVCAFFKLPAGRLFFFAGVPGSLVLIILGIVAERRRLDRMVPQAARSAEIEYIGPPDGDGQRDAVV
jgi:hypothetical protein